MADFHQPGNLSTFHRFGPLDTAKTDSELRRFSSHRPVTLILPTTYEELKGEAFKRIIQGLQEVTYLRRIIITMGQTDPEQFSHAKQFFADVLQNNAILWATGPRVQSLIDLLEQNNLSPGPDGKGRSVWFAFGYALSDSSIRVIALHDCDILTYDT